MASLKGSERGGVGPDLRRMVRLRQPAATAPEQVELKLRSFEDPVTKSEGR